MTFVTGTASDKTAFCVIIGGQLMSHGFTPLVVLTHSYAPLASQLGGVFYYT